MTPLPCIETVGALHFPDTAFTAVVHPPAAGARRPFPPPPDFAA